MSKIFNVVERKHIDLKKLTEQIIKWKDPQYHNILNSLK